MRQSRVALWVMVVTAVQVVGSPSVVAEPSSASAQALGAARVNLFFTDDLIERMKARVEREPWARRIWQSEIKSAREWMALGLAIPETGGGYSHDYACATDGARLQFDPRRPHEHWCPTCKCYLEGRKLDAYWVSAVHARFIQAARTLALASRLDGNPDDARRAKEVLLYYARHYEDYPIHGNAAGRGRIFHQSLTEAVNLLNAAAAYELLVPGHLTAAEARTIREQLFRPAAQLVSQFRFGIHNIQCWHAAFLLAAAIINDDAQLRDGALASLDENLAKGITPDGWWFEGSPGYHFYTLSALKYYLLAARHNGLTTPNTPRVADMLRAPFRVAYPDLRLPAINDGGRTSLASLAPHLELASYVLDDPHLAAMLASLYEKGIAGRTSFEGLCYGPDALPKAEAYTPKSERLDHVGAVILRRPRTDLYALLRTGRFQGWHDHPDRLSLALYGLGQELAPDLGSCAYRAPLIGWYKSSPAHNTIVIDEQSQNRQTSDAECVFFHDGPDYAAAALRATRLYLGVEMTRTVVVLDRALIDYCRVRSEAPHKIDWVYRNAGQLAVDQTVPPSLALFPRYAYLKELRGYRPDRPFFATWKVRGGKVFAALLAMQDTDLFTARGPGFPGRERMSMLLARRRASSADFVSVIQIVPDGKPILQSQIRDRAQDRVVVQLGVGPSARVFELTAASAQPLESPGGQ